MHILHEFRDEHQHVSCVLSRGEARWHLPPLGAIKINFDGIVSKQSGVRGGGWVLRDDTRAFMACKGLCLGHVASLAVVVSI